MISFGGFGGQSQLSRNGGPHVELFDDLPPAGLWASDSDGADPAAILVPPNS